MDAFVIDARGERHETTPEIWQEVYLSALLRSILYSDDANYRLAGYRKLDPISSPDAEHRFLQAAENLFFKGWQLGSDPEIQVATVVSNHLTAGILKYFGEANRYELAVNLFEKLYAREPEVAALVAQAYIGMNEEIKAVQIMHHAIKETPHSYSLLHVQCDFLRSKSKPDWAAKLAQESVNCAPTEFSTWAKLTECYVELERWEEALFTLNSCPMFTYNERDLHRMPTPARSHFPIKNYIAESGLLDEDNARDLEADAALVRLPAPALRGTFAKAYGLLTRLVAKIGWDELLRSRSQVFVMEEEYRAQKQHHDVNIPRSGDQSPSPNQEADLNASTHAIVASGKPNDDGDDLVDAGEENRAGLADTSNANDLAEKGAEAQEEDVSSKLATLGVSDASGNASSHSIPTIKISTESDHEREKVELEGFIKAQQEGHGDDQGSAGTVHEAQKALENGQPVKVEVEAPPLERPALAQAQAQAASEQEVNGINGTAETNTPNPQDGHHEQDETTVGSLSSSFAFNNKRLCERWLDNLFMVLYEDLRVYTIWRAEVNHYKTQSLPYRKTSTEWEILGELALRLHHREEAKDAFQRCVEGKFSAKAYLRLLDIYTEEREVERSLWVALRLTAYHHRWYMEGTYPSAVAHCLFRLIGHVGLAKVNFTLMSMSPPDPILRIMKNYFAYCQAFKVPGHDF